jgi:hypothetical protein
MRIGKHVEIEIDYDDVIDYIEECDSTSELQKIYDIVREEEGINLFDDYNWVDIYEIDTYNECAVIHNCPKIETLADRMKMDFITSIWDKYTVEQLELKLK